MNEVIMTKEKEYYVTPWGEVLKVEVSSVLESFSMGLSDIDVWEEGTEEEFILQ